MQSRLFSVFGLVKECVSFSSLHVASTPYQLTPSCVTWPHHLRSLSVFISLALITPLGVVCNGNHRTTTTMMNCFVQKWISLSGERWNVFKQDKKSSCLQLNTRRWSWYTFDHFINFLHSHSKLEKCLKGLILPNSSNRCWQTNPFSQSVLWGIKIRFWNKLIYNSKCEHYVAKLCLIKFLI